jgi:serine/threonine protein kinase
MKYFIKNKGEIVLSKANFLASGGQSNVFIKNGIAYKIYHDPQNTILWSKISELSVLQKDNIIIPQDIIFNDNNIPSGYTMLFIKDTYALCKLFTKAFKDRNSITNEKIIKLVQILVDNVKYIHNKNIIIVDLNELNCLVNNDFTNIYMIDTDSYQTPSFPATAIMESIRDRQNSNFSILTDHFSLAILTFQMFIGIHPYKGKHPKYKTLDERMIHNISVFNKDVSVPSVCYPVTVIPENYRNWYKAIFEDGKRIAPPDTMIAVIPIQTYTKDIINSIYFDTKEISSYDNNIISYFSKDNVKIAVTKDGGYFNSKIPDFNVKVNDSFAITPRNNYLIAARKNNDKLNVYNVSSGKQIDCDIFCEAIMDYDGRIYIKNGSGVYEIQFLELSNDIKVVSKLVGNASESSFKFFDGVVVQNLLGSWCVSLFPKSGLCYQIKIDEFDNYREIINAKFDNRVFIADVVDKNNLYDRFIIKFNNDYSDYDCRIEKDVQISSVNFVTLDNGVCVYMNNDEAIELFFNKKGQKDIKVVKDPNISGDIILFKDGIKTLFAKGKKIYYLMMKKGNN